jgi:hypothetical protein
MVGQKRSVSFEEVQQIRHLLEVGRDVRVIAAKMNIVELNVDDMLDAVAEIALRQCRLGERGGDQSGGREYTHASHLWNPPTRCC